MYYEDKWCFGQFLIEIKSPKEKLLKDSNTITSAEIFPRQKFQSIQPQNVKCSTNKIIQYRSPFY